MRSAWELERLDVYWLEEALRTDDLEGYSLLRARTSIRLAAGEMVRGMHEARDLILRIYWPRADALDGSWTVPAVERVK